MLCPDIEHGGFQSQSGACAKIGRGWRDRRGPRGLRGSDSDTCLPFAPQRLIVTWRVSQEAMQVDPECVSALCGLAGLCQEELGDSQRARKLLEKALQLQPQHVDSLFQRGSLAEEEGGRAAEARALKWYRRAATLDPTHVPALVSAADLLAGTGEYAEAERMYKQAVEVEPQVVAPAYSCCAFALQCSGLTRRGLRPGGASAEKLGGHGRGARSISSPLSAYALRYQPMRCPVLTWGSP
eukprot:2758946-Rhodomonas_salina.2